MALTRANVEAILIRRLGGIFEAVGLDGATADGSNEDLNDPIGWALVSVPRTARSGFLPHYFPFSLTNRSLEPDSIGISVYSKLYRHLFVFTCVVIEREIKSRKVLLTR